MQQGVVRKPHWSRTKLSISKILAIFITTQLVCHETIDKFAQSKVNIVRFCNRKSDWYQWYTQKYTAGHINLPLHMEGILDEAVIGDSDLSTILRAGSGERKAWVCS